MWGKLDESRPRRADVKPVLGRPERPPTSGLLALTSLVFELEGCGFRLRLRSALDLVAYQGLDFHRSRLRPSLCVRFFPLEN